MGYHVSIIRTDGGKNIPISESEIRECILDFKELEIKKDSLANILITYKPLAEESPLIIWDKSGELWTKNPDKFTLELMIRLADKLRARVRGDELETYISSEDTYIHEDDKVEFEKTRKVREGLKSHIKRKRLIGAIAISTSLIAIVFLLMKSMFKM